MTAALHDDLVVVRRLIGTWVGRGSGSYPSIQPFRYDETVEFGHVGKPFLSYAQRTVHSDDGRPLHAETGYLRPTAALDLELMVAHPTGVVELSEGPWMPRSEGGSVLLRSRTVACSTSAKPVIAIEREFTLAGDVLRYVLRMAAVGFPLIHHLEAELHRSTGQ